MKYKSLVAASLALSLAAAPVIATAPASAAPVPATETVEGSELYRTGILVPLAGLAALALAIYLIFDPFGEDEDEPISP